MGGCEAAIDLLCLDRAGQLVVVELKRTEDGGHVELQALRYAAMVSTLQYADVERAYRIYLKKTNQDPDEAEQRLAEWLTDVDTEETPVPVGEPRIILVSAGFGKEITSAVLWLNRIIASNTDIDPLRKGHAVRVARSPVARRAAADPVAGGRRVHGASPPTTDQATNIRRRRRTTRSSRSCIATAPALVRSRNVRRSVRWSLPSTPRACRSARFARSSVTSNCSPSTASSPATNSSTRLWHLPEGESEHPTLVLRRPDRRRPEDVGAVQDVGHRYCGHAREAVETLDDHAVLLGGRHN